MADAGADEGQDQAAGDGAQRDELGVEALDDFVGTCEEELGLAWPDYVEGVLGEGDWLVSWRRRR